MRAVYSTEMPCARGCLFARLLVCIPYRTDHSDRVTWGSRRRQCSIRVKLVGLSLHVAALCVTLPRKVAQAQRLVHRCLLAPMTGAATYDACIDRCQKNQKKCNIS